MVLVGIALVVLLYREVVSVYTRAGGSYVVARDNFGPRIAQVAAVALMIDYIVTVAVQTAAGSAAILSAFPALGKPLGGNTTLLLISVVAILIMCYGNLRGIREAGRTFALPTYLFSGSVGLMIVVGLPGRPSAALPRVPPGPGRTARLPRSSRQQPAGGGVDIRPAARLRQRWFVADRHRSGLQRGKRPPSRRGATPGRC